MVRCALLLAPLLFVRPGDLRKAEWAGFDLEKAEWRYLVTKTKTGHLVPLSTQAVSILKELHNLTGNGGYVFLGRDPQKPMSEAAVNAALRRMGQFRGDVGAIGDVLRWAWLGRHWCLCQFAGRNAQ